MYSTGADPIPTVIALVWLVLGLVMNAFAAAVAHGVSRFASIHRCVDQHSAGFFWGYTLPETNIAPESGLKWMVGRLYSFLLGMPIFMDKLLVSGRVCWCHFKLVQVQQSQVF